MAKREGFYQRIARQKGETLDELNKLRQQRPTFSEDVGAWMEKSKDLMDQIRELERLEKSPPWQPLLRAILKGDLTEVQALTVDDAVIAELNDELVPVLLQPAYAGDEGIVTHLLSRGIDPNIPGNDNLTALSCAAIKDEDKIFQKLIAAGADPTVRTTQGDTIEKLARYNGSEKVLKILAEKNTRNQGPSGPKPG